MSARKNNIQTLVELSEHKGHISKGEIITRLRKSYKLFIISLGVMSGQFATKQSFCFPFMIEWHNGPSPQQVD